MHYVELDVHNLRRWLRSEIGTGAERLPERRGSGVMPDGRHGLRGLLLGPPRRNRDNFARRHARRASSASRTTSTADANSVPNNTLDGAFIDTQGEPLCRGCEPRDDQTYGCIAADAARSWLGRPAQNPTCSCHRRRPARPTPQSNEYDSLEHARRSNVARVNRAYFFRRALKLVNGGRGDLPANRTQGLTVASENPVYVQGNYNACTKRALTRPTSGNSFNPACTGGVGFGAVPGTDHVSAAVIADAVTLLSNGWNDIRSFVIPTTRASADGHTVRESAPRRRRRSIAWRSSPERASTSRVRPATPRRSHRLRDRRRRAQLPALHRELGRRALNYRGSHDQLLHQPAGGRYLQVLRHGLRAADAAATTSTPSS